MRCIPLSYEDAHDLIDAAKAHSTVIMTPHQLVDECQRHGLRVSVRFVNGGAIIRPGNCRPPIRIDPECAVQWLCAKASQE